MVKIAVFVEGLTERIFIKRLIVQHFTNLRYTITEEKRKRWEYISVQSTRFSLNTDYCFSLVELPSYDLLFPYVIDNVDKMVSKEGYDFLVGLRDLLPAKREDKSIILNTNNKILNRKRKQDKVALILAVMETEAWFLCDDQLFERINPILTSDYIKETLGLDLVKDDPELQYDEPAKVIDSILIKGGFRYHKHRNGLKRVINRIDMDYLLSCQGKIDSLFRFIQAISYRLPSQHTTSSYL